MERNEKAIELEALIKKHQDLYYNGIPELSDADFDLLWDELRLLEPNNQLFSTIPKDEGDGFKKARHIIPMGSQEKAANNEAFLAWSSNHNYESYLVQYKLDGASLELQYENGHLIKAVTRGDGVMGDDITFNAIKMQGVIKELKGEASPKGKTPFTGAVRGEVIMPKAIFNSMYMDKANCRNAANGIMKRKDGKGCEYLQVICYDAGKASQNTYTQYFNNEIEKIEWLKAAGFNVVQTKICKNAQEVIKLREEIATKRANLPFDIDGLVIKNIEIDLEDLKRSRPDKQIAFKFELEKAISTILDVEWSESGATYTPIAMIEPVHLAGTKVKRASLANPNVITSLNLMIGSRVIVSKRGEIIPKIEALVENPLSSTPIPIPQVCSSCNTTLINEGTRLYCPNYECKKVKLHRIEKWVNVLDLKEVGKLLLKRLFDEEKVLSIKDLYTITAQTLSNMERMGELSSQKVYASIHAKKEISLAEFIAGFDIEDVGIIMAEKIEMAGFNTLEKLFLATKEEIANIEGWAEKSAESFINGLNLVKKEMEELLASGYILIKSIEKVGRLQGLSFCFTGELNAMKRKDAEKMVRDAGGMVKSSVTKDLSYLVTNTPDSGSSKNKKAKEFNIKIIKEEDFFHIIEDRE
ncbi:MAG: NAD-dependent DNA ligase LigA [Treponema sp.]